MECELMNMKLMKCEIDELKNINMDELKLKLKNMNMN